MDTSVLLRWELQAYHKLVKNIGYRCADEKNLSIHDASFVALEKSWLPLSEYRDHTRWKTKKQTV